MSYGESKRYYIERRLAQGMQRTGAATIAAYLALLPLGGAEAEELINSVTVNETYFYREEHQLRCLSGSILPEIVARRGPGDLVRLWSVPCSTGEEPYSIAIWLLENWPLVDAYNIEIVGSDVDTEALAAALAAITASARWRGCPPTSRGATSRRRAGGGAASSATCASPSGSRRPTSWTRKAWRRRGASTRFSAATS
jgi:chemotaxis protein methyltransferase CheR